jgi:hypothetical protein
MTIHIQNVHLKSIFLLVYPDDGYAPIAIESPNEYVANIYRQF